ncbi:S7A6O protein, partial [Rostratula benghalensis]|nr:S7A6O protein [Rostratula benghalensis]
MERAAAVLRVQRKRGGTEPAEALLLACKRLRTEGGGGGQPVKSLFKLVATVSSKNEPVQKYVQEVIAREKAAQSLRPSLGNTQRIIRELRSSKQEKRKENRYRVIASHRPHPAGAVALLGDGEAWVDGDRSDSAATEGATQKESGAMDKSWGCCGKFQLFDIEQEEEVVEDSNVAAAKAQLKADPDVILCNAVEMIRERLSVSEDRKKELHEKDEYVYDIYYMETSAPGWIENILSVQPYREEYELVDDDDGDGEIDEDEDDENDENNWRNDYPDEDEFLAEEEESDDSFSDEDQRSRRRTWNKYQQEVLQEFGYDEIQDLDSD